MSNLPTWTKCRLPPCVCRLLARTKDDLLATNAELEAATGWTRSKLIAVYRAANWNEVKVGDMDRFLWACGLTPHQQRRYLWLLKRAWRRKDGIQSMRHLRTAGMPAWRIFLVHQLVRMAERVLENDNGKPRHPGRD